MSDLINNKCIGCSVVNGDFVPIGGIIYESKSFVLAQDAEIPLPGFLIIQSKKHVNSILGFDFSEQQELMELICKARKALDELNVCKEVNIVQEEKALHFHVWIFPFQDWMKEKFGKGIKYLRDINEYIEKNATEEDIRNTRETAEKIRDYLKKL